VHATQEKIEQVEIIYKKSIIPVYSWETFLEPIEVLDSFKLRALLEQPNFKNEFDRFVNEAKVKDEAIHVYLKDGLSEALKDYNDGLLGIIGHINTVFNSWTELLGEWHEFISEVVCSTSITPGKKNKPSWIHNLLTGVKKNLDRHGIHEYLEKAQDRKVVSESYALTARKYRLNVQEDRYHNTNDIMQVIKNTRVFAEIWKQMADSLADLSQTYSEAFKEPQYRYEFEVIWKQYEVNDQSFRKSVESAFKSIEGGLLDELQVQCRVMSSILDNWREMTGLWDSVQSAMRNNEMYWNM
jgi:hypothetical protein